jgi:hypothetical protein
MALPSYLDHRVSVWFHAAEWGADAGVPGSAGLTSAPFRASMRCPRLDGLRRESGVEMEVEAATNIGRSDLAERDGCRAQSVAPEIPEAIGCEGRIAHPRRLKRWPR